MQGVIDDVAFDVTFFNGFAMYESASYVLMAPKGAVANTFAVSKKRMDTLPADLQELIKSKFVCKFPQLERADYIIRVTFDTGFG